MFLQKGFNPKSNKIGGYSENDGSIDYSIEIEQLEFSISSILSDLSVQEFQPIKEPLKVEKRLPLKTIFFVVGLIICVIGIILIWMSRVKPQYRKFDYSTYESPRERAFDRIDGLNNTGQTKNYYIELSHIIRELIERKYFIRTLEMTTNEIKLNRVIFPFSDSLFNSLVKLLNDADEVKYARVIPNSEKIDKDKLITINLIKTL